MKSRISFVFVFFWGFIINGFSCTSIIVSGKVSSDGRPFIFKNEDNLNSDVVVVTIQGERYVYSALVNAGDLRPNRANSGFNEVGFSIINTYARNLNGGRMDARNNTIVMRRALEICSTLSDFENLLDTLSRPLRINSNFGVMDASGGIAYYETSNSGYVKFDANDPVMAPNGYLIRTNYGLSGSKDYGYGFERFTAMKAFIGSISKEGKINSKDVIRGATRYLTHGKSKINLLNNTPRNGGLPVFVDFTDFIPRQQTASAQLIQGVKLGENPLETVGWTICGSPLTTVCIPIWIKTDYKLPKIVSRDNNGHSPMSDAGLELKKRLFPPSNMRGKEDINIAQLVNKVGTGILQRIEPIEDEIFRRADIVIMNIRKRGSAGAETDVFYKWLDMYIPAEYKKRFGIENFYIRH